MAFTKYTYLKGLHGLKMPSDTYYRVLVTLLDYANKDGTRAFPGNEQLAKDCACSVDTVKRALKWAKAQGLVNLDKRGRHNSGASEWSFPQQCTAAPSQAVSIEVKDGRKQYHIRLADGKTAVRTDREILHIPGISLDGIRGISPISIARNSFGTSLAAENSAGRTFNNGALMSGIVTPTSPEGWSAEEITAVRDTLDRVVTGQANAGSLAVLSGGLDFQQWSVNPVDAQWLESRRFQLSEVARMFRVPPHLIGDVTGSTSWGSGIEQQTLGFQKFTLQSWTQRIEARLSRLLSPELKAEFDYRQLLSGSPGDEIQLLIVQKQAGAITTNEFRAILNMAPVEGGDVLAVDAQAVPAA